MPTKKLLYSKEKLNLAINEIKNGATIYAISKKFGIPKSTLGDKIHGKYQEGKKSGPLTILTLEEENLVVKWAIEISKLGFPVTKEQLIDSVSVLVKKLNRENNFKNGIPGRKWFLNFMKRHPELTERVSQNLTKSRSSISETGLRNWFKTIREYLVQQNYLDILEDPNRIFNCDETAFFLCPKEKSVLVQKGTKQVYTRIANDEKECITVLVMIGANGSLPPPMILYTYKRLPHQIIRKMPREWGFGRSDSGWMTAETFFEYITNVFYKWLQKNNIKFPVLLYVDGHTSHISLHLSEFCKKNCIILVALLPNATHILQPCDVALFHPLKVQWKKEVRNYRWENNGKKLDREDFAPLLENCLNRSAKKSTVINGFKTCGLYPFNPDIINYDALINSVEAEKEDNTINTINNKPKDPNKITNTDYLKFFESRLDIDLLNSFKKCNDIWNGDPWNGGLFDYWRALKNTSSDSNEVNIPDFDTSFWFKDSDVVDLILEPSGSLIIPKNVENLRNQENKENHIGNAINYENLDDQNVTNLENESFEILEKTPLKTTRASYPTPFKNSLFWPETEKQIKNKIKKRLTPTVATSDEFIEYQRRIQVDKDKKEEEKRIRKEKRENDKVEKSIDNKILNKTEKNYDKLTDDKSNNKGHVSDHVIIIYEDEYFPGIILNKKNDQLEIKTMQMSGVNWRWPEKEDILWYKNKDVLQYIEPPSLLTSRGLYSVPEMAQYRNKN